MCWHSDLFNCSVIVVNEYWVKPGHVLNADSQRRIVAFFGFTTNTKVSSWAVVMQSTGKLFLCFRVIFIFVGSKQI